MCMSVESDGKRAYRRVLFAAAESTESTAPAAGPRPRHGPPALPVSSPLDGDRGTAPASLFEGQRVTLLWANKKPYVLTRAWSLRCKRTIKSTFKQLLSCFVESAVYDKIIKKDELYRREEVFESE